MTLTITETNLLAVMHQRGCMDLSSARRWGNYYLALRRLVRKGLAQTETLPHSGRDRYTLTAAGEAHYVAAAKNDGGLDARSKMKGVKPAGRRR